MKRYSLLLPLVFVFFVKCASDPEPLTLSRSGPGVVPATGHTEEEILISAEFIDDNTYVIVCKGFPLPELTGENAINSAKEAARLNAISFIFFINYFHY